MSLSITFADGSSQLKGNFSTSAQFDQEEMAENFDGGATSAAAALFSQIKVGNLNYAQRKINSLSRRSSSCRPEPEPELARACPCDLMRCPGNGQFCNWTIFLLPFGCQACFTNDRVNIVAADKEVRCFLVKNQFWLSWLRGPSSLMNQEAFLSTYYLHQYCATIPSRGMYICPISYFLVCYTLKYSW